MPANNEVRYPEVARRIQTAIAQSPHIPTEYGTLSYIAREFKKRFDVDVSREMVRTWVNGLREPRPERRGQLAEILDVDYAYLWSGVADPEASRSKGEAAEMTCALFMQAGGWKVRHAKTRDYDFDAELGGRSYKIECKAANALEGGKWSVKAPRNIKDVVFLVVYVNAAKAEIAVLHVDAEPGAEVVMQPSAGDMIVQGGSAKVIEDFTKPI